MNNERSSSEPVLDVFINVEAHRLAADLIRKHSANPQDIRNVALDSLDLSACRNIIDLGCGFGFFTEALKGKIPSDAVVTGIDIVHSYKPLFLDVCKKGGFQGRFLHLGSSLLKDLGLESCDLALCSYALYFFPETIPDIAKVLRDDGMFITITHGSNNMDELISATKDVMIAQGATGKNRFPFEEIVSRFSAENGHDMLSPWFGRVEIIDYVNTLVFRPDEIANLVEYFRFKSPFFLSGTGYETENIASMLGRHLEISSRERHGFTLSKNDRIFICSLPLHKEKRL
jgi:SAM-dependent methyltransferase